MKKYNRLMRLTVFLTCIIAFAMPAIAQENGTHTVESGETLFRIALRYGVDMNALAHANNIPDPRRIFAGQTIVIPGLSVVDESQTVNNPLIAAAPVTHVVQRGEILSRIAQSYGVTVAQILAANDIANPDRIEVGDVLQIWTDNLSTVQTTSTEPASIEVAAVTQPIASGTTHVVQRGEYLSQIALRYGVRWTAIAELNGITDPNRVFAGMTLQIPTGGAGGGGLGIISNSGDGVTAYWGTGREIVVILSTQMVYAFEDGELRYSALSSTGLPATPTVRGDFNIWHKTRAQTMSGPGYYLPNVEWVMYFYQGYGLHGTYWHSNFGQPMSRGCVNLTNGDAEWFYNFASIGTPVHVRW